MQDYRDYYRQLNDQLSTRIGDLAYELLGEPTFKKTSEWRYGQKGSLSITISGPYQGRFHDFEKDIHGSSLDLISHLKGIKGRELCQWARHWLRLTLQEVWTPIMPIPQGVSKPDFRKAPLNYLLDGRTVEAIYPYRSLQGNLLGYVVRLKDKHNHKITPTLTYCQSNLGRFSWYWKGFREKRSPYGLEKIKDTTASILIVEGEKTAEAAQQLFPHYSVLTWAGGAKAVLKTDWSPLKQRDIILWPDNDPAGHEAMQKLAHHLKEIGNQEVRIVSLPDNTPPKWDLADPIPPVWIANFIALSLEQEESSINSRVPYINRSQPLEFFS
ncbi:DUF6371 domain-containing protein [Candidatus Odyssella acanthamoebae]|uniref:Toprim domain-containing protein n=1 Tax=Candidatus Odyssella acanthamoebae TaxID=91604 RepID=A0A077B0W2_9PROT|nr:DUF6371 domain-containing protein [Candidatus Paracaedibacter acanthamoebae]AIK96580.1 hypothetical protein ID47_07360 [Candidatus Paracaedibacter acanthamoebae]